MKMVTIQSDFTCYFVDGVCSDKSNKGSSVEFFYVGCSDNYV